MFFNTAVEHCTLWKKTWSSKLTAFAKEAPVVMENFTSSSHSVQLSVESQTDWAWSQLSFGHPGQCWFALQLL